MKTTFFTLLLALLCSALLCSATPAKQAATQVSTSEHQSARCSRRRVARDLACLCFLANRGLFPTNDPIGLVRACIRTFAPISLNRLGLNCRPYFVRPRIISIPRAVAGIQFTLRVCLRRSASRMLIPRTEMDEISEREEDDDGNVDNMDMSGDDMDSIADSVLGSGEVDASG